MRLGLFGGSFDPVHYGHLLLAETCRVECRLEQVWFVPAATSPHKKQQQTAPAEKRCEMLQLAVGGYEPFDISRLEIDRGGLSYTIDTLRAIQSEDPTRELFLLLGADALWDLPNWREPGEICSLATPIVATRAGEDPPDYAPLERLLPKARVDEIRRQQVAMPAIGFSSSDIRRRVAAGKSIRYQTPRAVEKYIETEGLYCG